MTQLDLLLPFALPSPEMAKDLLRAMQTPALATLVSRARQTSKEHGHEFSRALPHEQWLAAQFGLASLSAESSPSVAAPALRSMGLPADKGIWFLLQPVHIHIARDHLVLTDIRKLPISEQESRAFFDMARPIFAESGKELVYGDARTWFVRADEWKGLHTSTPDAACGHNIDIWMPKGPGEREWRRLQNEVQMHWHGHALNSEREMLGMTPVNSLWLWGGSDVDSQPRDNYDLVCGLSGWMQALKQPMTKEIECRAESTISASAPRILSVLDDLIEPALAGDWGNWLARFGAVEIRWIAPLVAALREGRIDRIRLICTNDTDTAIFPVTRASLRKFWIKPSLSRLLP
jgi:hypothetical protein